MTCPAICVIERNTPKWFYLTSVKKYAKRFGDDIVGACLPQWYSDEERYDVLSNWALNHLISSGVKAVNLEGYSMGSRAGLIIQLAEATGLLKHKITRHMPAVTLTVVPPTSLKKDATGKGNATKEIMYKHYTEMTGYFLCEKLDQKTLASPVSDMVDSYYLAMYGCNGNIYNRSHVNGRQCRG